MKQQTAIMAAFALTMATAPWAHAQFTGPGSPAAHTEPMGPVKTVDQVFKNSRDDQWVTLTGQVVRQIGRQKYLFRDSTGEIRIEIDGKAMPTEPFNEKTRVEIRGEVEKEFLRSIEIDVKEMKLLP